VAATAETGEPVDTTSTEPDAAAADRRRRVATVALAAAMVLLLVGALLLGLRVRGAALDDQAREQALTAARQSALNLTSIGREDFEGAYGRVLDGATGEFRQDFAGRREELQRLVQENEVDAEGRVLDAAIVRSDRTSATALVVVDSRVRNTAVPEGRVNSYRMKVELEKVGDQWLASALEFVA
jgi:Mce-associated membrane protein